MESKSSLIDRQLRFFTATLYAQIKLSTRDGKTDLAKSQEVSLLKLINIAFNQAFIDLNLVQKNFKGLDYGDYSSHTGLQMSATVTRQKFLDTLNKINSESNLKNSFQKIFFFLLTVEPVSSSVTLYSNDIQVMYLTLFDMVSAVQKYDLDFQIEFLETLKQEYSNYFDINLLSRSQFSYLPAKPAPPDLVYFNELIGTDEWFLNNVGEGYIKVSSLINSLITQISNCSIPAREILVSIIKSAPFPINQTSKIRVYLDIVYGRLNISPTTEGDFQAHFNYLELNDLVETQDDYQGFSYSGDDVIINNRKFFSLNFNVSEPEMNLYSALILFYKKYHSLEEFERAITCNDFHLLSDSYCK